MFFLHSSNRTEKLADQLAAIVASAGVRSLFATECFLVQSRGMERMLSQFLADRFGVWCNSRFLLPLEFIEQLCRLLHLDTDGSAYERSLLTWRVERLLRRLDSPDLGALATYLSGEQAEIKRFQLARTIAHFFDQYQIMRPDFLRAWEQGRQLTANPAEIWQRRLWQRLRGEAPLPHRGEVVGSLVDHLERHEDLDLQGLERVFVFGVHTLPPCFLATLRALGRHLDLHLFLLSPSALYWGDIESPRARLRRQGGLDRERSGPGSPHHPLLASLGRQGADFQELLLTHVEEYVDGLSWFDPPGAGDTPTLLECLKSDLLHGREAERSVALPPGDDSIVVASCHTQMREIEVLRDHILGWLYEDPGLNLHDIVVMAPDIDEYAGLIPAVFEDLAHDISDCRKRRDNRYVAVFLEFLALLAGRYTLADLLGLLEHPEVHRTFSLAADDLRVLEHWLREAGVRWGLSADQRRVLGQFAGADGTWRQALEAMVMGLATGTEEEVGDLVPYPEIEGGDAELLGSLCSFVGVIEEAETIGRRPHSLRSWSAALHRMSTLLFGDGNDPDLLDLQAMVAELGRVPGVFHDEPVVFEVVRSWLDSEAEATSAGLFLRGRLTFCSMLPMRSIPFQVICLLGLNDGAFPKQDQFSPFNLLLTEYRRGDRSSRADDRYQFLEAILAARHRLYISFVGQSVRTNQKRPPSVVVAELLDTLQRDFGVRPVTHHPLHPYSDRYFRDDEPLFSFSEHHCAAARALREPPAPLRQAWVGEPVAVPDVDACSLDELIRFCISPQRYFVQTVMGMQLGIAEREGDEHEPFALEGLPGYLVDQEIVAGLLRGVPADRLRRRLQARQRWPQGFPGNHRFSARCREMEPFLARLESLGARVEPERCPVAFEIDRFRLHGTIELRPHRGLLLFRYAHLKGRDLLAGWLLHLAARVGLQPAATHVAGRDMTVCFGAETGGEADLGRLLDFYRRGRRLPSKLYVEPALAYCRQVILNRGRGRKEPLDTAVEYLDRQLTEGHLPELGILYPEHDGAALLDAEFERLCADFFLPIVDAAAIVTEAPDA